MLEAFRMLRSNETEIFRAMRCNLINLHCRNLSPVIIYLFIYLFIYSNFDTDIDIFNVKTSCISGTLKANHKKNLEMSSETDCIAPLYVYVYCHNLRVARAEQQITWQLETFR